MGLSTLIWKARDELLAIGCYTGKKRGKLNKYTTDSNNYISPFLTILPTTKATTSDTTVVPPSIPAKTGYPINAENTDALIAESPLLKNQEFDLVLPVFLMPQAVLYHTAADVSYSTLP